MFKKLYVKNENFKIYFSIKNDFIVFEDLLIQSPNRYCKFQGIPVSAWKKVVNEETKCIHIIEELSKIQIPVYSDYLVVYASFETMIVENLSSISHWQMKWFEGSFEFNWDKYKRFNQDQVCIAYSPEDSILLAWDNFHEIVMKKINPEDFYEYMLNEICSNKSFLEENKKSWCLDLVETNSMRKSIYSVNHYPEIINYRDDGKFNKLRNWFFDKNVAELIFIDLDIKFNPEDKDILVF